MANHKHFCDSKKPVFCYIPCFQRETDYDFFNIFWFKMSWLTGRKHSAVLRSPCHTLYKRKSISWSTIINKRSLRLSSHWQLLAKQLFGSSFYPIQMIWKFVLSMKRAFQNCHKLMNKAKQNWINISKKIHSKPHEMCEIINNKYLSAPTIKNNSLNNCS